VPAPRPTARVVLLDPEDRVLLMRGRLPSAPGGASYWFTIGGGVEPGESVKAAAVREALEETGLADIELGPELWYDEAILPLVDGTPALFQQHYFLGRTRGGALSRGGWQAPEHSLVDELRWWTLAELQRTREQIYPEGFAELLADVLAGRIAPTPLVVRTLEGPVRPSPRA
jgi:8-oxo-dGTP pyrophosphatase MutT (NUDIX family)